MVLTVFGVGLGRTGTDSLKKALEILGFGPCYHMFEVLADQKRVDQWVSLSQGETPDWDNIFDGYHSSVDWPAAHYWREIAAHFPDAKIVLSVRDPEHWFKSMSNTILPVLSSGTDPNSLGNQLFVPQVFEGNIEDRNHIIEIFNRHNASVQAAFGPERLLTFELGAGWAPLCAFLGVDVPDVPYPSGNSTDEFDGNMDEANAPRLGT